MLCYPMTVELTNLEDGDPGESDIVERYCALERIVTARLAVGIVDVPVDARAVRGRVVVERIRATVALLSVLYERRQVKALGHTL